MNTKYIFVTGGVMSGVGKGVSTASIGKILQSKGYKVSAVKIDPYINVDAGTMAPTEHGEVYVTEDGDETDQDLGNYERFLNQNILSTNYMTTGRVYLSVIEKERNLEYGGKNVEVVPDIPLEVISRLEKAAQETQADFLMVEIGGTIGEYQNILFLEAARMLKIRKPDDVLFLLVSYLPVPKKIGEMKTKPTQYACRTLNSAGIQPDFIICRSSHPLDDPRKVKISTFCNVRETDVVSAPDVDTIYEIPLLLEDAGIGNRILEKFGLEPRKKNLEDWRALVSKMKTLDKKVKIGVIGKYFETGNFVLADSYISVIEAIKHACWSLDLQPDLVWINSAEFEESKDNLKVLDELDGVIVPGGFGTRGIEGKILAIQYARENKIPYLGLCYGMQLASIEFARNVAGIADATTMEMDPQAKNAVIHVMEGQVDVIRKKKYGGTMRLGAYPARLREGSLAAEAYGTNEISERHRHRYEFNNDFRSNLEEKGLIFSGTSPDDSLVEIIELPRDMHPFFVAVQFHPEFKSRPLEPHPLFRMFVQKAIEE